MKKVRLYIADMDDAFVARLRGIIGRGGAIELAGSSGNGLQALNDLLRLSPDVLLADVSLPGLDGIALLKESQRLKPPPAAIVCAGFYSSACMACARRYGASFFLCKPIEPDSLVDLILECGRCRGAATEVCVPSEDEAERRRAASAVSLLKRLGMPAKLSGSAYIVEAAARYQGDALLMKNLSRGLYAELAGRMNTTVPRIERSLRSAIAIAYERGELRERFPQRPSNKAFIEYVMRAVNDD